MSVVGLRFHLLTWQSGGDQRERAREKAAKKAVEKGSKGNKEGLSALQRKER